MLAYVFWHWPQPAVDGQLYTSNLAHFHETLHANRPEGFHHSTVFMINNASWLETSGSAFEEWYLLDDSAAMDRLNLAAVTGPCEQPHNFVAKDAADGKAGLYRLRVGKADLSNKRFAFWFSKPAGVSYKDFFDQLHEYFSPETALWQRQMTLGPTVEFCLMSENEAAYTADLLGQRIPLRLIWSNTSL
jgi:hypothetical protein